MTNIQRLKAEIETLKISVRVLQSSPDFLFTEQRLPGARARWLHGQRRVCHDKVRKVLRAQCDTGVCRMRASKSTAAFVLSGIILLATGCGSSDTSHEKKENSGKVLVVYFSNPQSDATDADTGASRNLESGDLMGNVEYTASLIRQKTNADVFRIETAEPYPAQYKATTDQAKEEQNKNARPELKAHLDNIGDYDVVYLGYPNWWGDLPMPVYTFLDETDLSGKKVYPFVCHGGSKASSTVSTIKELEPKAEVSDDVLTLYWDEISKADDLVDEWIG